MYSMTDIQAIMPMLIVTLSAVVTMVAEAFRPKGERVPMGGLGIIGLVGAAIASVLLWNRDLSAFGVVRADNFALFINITLTLIGILTILFSSEVVEREELPTGEYYTLLLFSIAGMMLMASATDLLLVFLALEILSLAVYVLTGIRRSSAAGAEAAFKYFLLGAFSSAFFLYGIAMTYVLTMTYGQRGSTRLDEIAAAVANQTAGSPSILLYIALGAAAGRLRLQGVGRAVPHVDARRVSGRADGGHRLHVDGREGGGVRGVRARVPVGVRRGPRRLGAGAVGHRDRDDDRRLGRRRRAEQRQAHAGVFEHRRTAATCWSA